MRVDATTIRTRDVSVRHPSLLSKLWRHRIGAVGLSLTTVFFLLAVLAPWLAPYDPTLMHRGAELASPSFEHMLGTDHLGRDLLSRVLFGLRTSFFLSIIAVAAGATVGVSIGLIAGFLGGHVETLLMRLTDVLMPFPTVLLGLGLAAVIGVGVTSVGIAIAIACIPIFARVTRAATLAEREKEYVEAASGLGMAPIGIMARHILPNCSAPLLVQASVSLAEAVLIEAGLSFLGLGTQPPTASLGAMLDTARGYMRRSPEFAIFPGLAITLLLLGLHYVADAFRDVSEKKR